MHKEAAVSITNWTFSLRHALVLCLYRSLCLPSEGTLSFQPAWGIHSVPTLLHPFIIYSPEMGFVTAAGGVEGVGVGFKENRFAKAPCLRPLSLRSWRQGPAELMIRQIYGAISVSHLLPASRRIKGKISGWHWDRDYPVCAIWLHTSTGCFSFTCLTFLFFAPPSFMFSDLWKMSCTDTNNRKRIKPHTVRVHVHCRCIQCSLPMKIKHL